MPQRGVHRIALVKRSHGLAYLPISRGFYASDARLPDQIISGMRSKFPQTQPCSFIPIQRRKLPPAAAVLKLGFTLPLPLPIGACHRSHPTGSELGPVPCLDGINTVRQRHTHATFGE